MSNHIQASMLTTALVLGALGLAGCQSQQTFSSPDAAASALTSAVQEENRGELRKLFGSRGRELRSGDPDQDRADLQVFSRRLGEHREISMVDAERAELLLGSERWPFAVPIVKDGDAWRFDTDAGIEELTNRRIGRNELRVIAACRTVIDGQREYYSQDRNGDGVLEYAQRLMSTEGTRDGLYWPAPGGVDPSPIGPVLAAAASRTDEAGQRLPYYGYLFKPLRQRGPGAPGGAGTYAVNGKLTQGWAVLAHPAEYGETGIMSFQFGSDGTVYEKDLGDGTDDAVKHMDAYDPTDGWTPTSN